MFVVHGTGMGGGSEPTKAEPEPSPPVRGDVDELLLWHAGLLMLAAVTHLCSRPATCGDREPVITAGAAARLGAAPTEPAAAAARSEKCRRRRSHRATSGGAGGGPIIYEVTRCTCCGDGGDGRGGPEV